MSATELLANASNYFIAILAAGFALLCFLRDKAGATFAGVTLFFFFMGNFYFPFLISWDEERIFRYPIWFFHELSWMALIAYLGLKDIVSMKQSIVGQLFAIPLLCVNAFRGMDFHYMGLFASQSGYQLIYPICELAIVLLCWLPIFVYLKNKLFAKPQLA